MRCLIPTGVARQPVHYWSTDEGNRIVRRQRTVQNVFVGFHTSECSLMEGKSTRRINMDPVINVAPFFCRNIICNTLWCASCSGLSYQVLVPLVSMGHCI